VAAIAGIVLAGGRSSRMGGPDKASLDLGGKQLALHALERLSKQVRTVVLNTNVQGVAYSGYTVIADDVAGYAGPLAGVAAGLRWANQLGFERCVTVAVDTPFFPDDLAARLSAEFAEIVLASSGRRAHPTFALWATHLAADIEHFLQSDPKRRVRDFVHSRDHASVEFAFQDTSVGPVDPFFNINTPADLERARVLVEALS
jgi:molybdenum cofactor guanylyltransferase